MKIKDQSWYDESVKANSQDAYGSATLAYAIRWAEAMEKALAEGSKIQEIAGPLSHECDIEGITGFMYGCAVGFLAKTWEYGEDLRKWSNHDIAPDQPDNGGVINPAIITISPR